jgi:heme exporter protein A
MLTVKDLTFSFKNRPLFKGLSFSVGPGALIRLTGSNGSGKSTLLGLLTGLISGAKGSITFEECDSSRRSLSWIAPDANGLVPSLSATANLHFWLGLRHTKIDIDRIQTSLETWGLNGEWVQNRLPVARFSTGMRRRLSLARLELEDTRLWLLDEPLFGLDESACQKFRAALKAHIDLGGAAIVVTHDERLLSGLTFETIVLGGLTS